MPMNTSDVTSFRSSRSSSVRHYLESTQKAGRSVPQVCLIRFVTPPLTAFECIEGWYQPLRSHSAYRSAVR